MTRPLLTKIGIGGEFSFPVRSKEYDTDSFKYVRRNTFVVLISIRD